MLLLRRSRKVQASIDSNDRETQQQQSNNSNDGRSNNKLTDWFVTYVATEPELCGLHHQSNAPVCSRRFNNPRKILPLTTKQTLRYPMPSHPPLSALLVWSIPTIRIDSPHLYVVQTAKLITHMSFSTGSMNGPQHRRKSPSTAMMRTTAAATTTNGQQQQQQHRSHNNGIITATKSIVENGNKNGLWLLWVATKVVNRRTGEIFHIMSFAPLSSGSYLHCTCQLVS